MGIEIRKPREAGKQVQRSEITLAIWRFKVAKAKREGRPIPAGIALPWVYVNGRVFYRQSDIDSFLAASEPGFQTLDFAKDRLRSPGAPKRKAKKSKAA